MMNRTLIAAALTLACAGAFAQTSATSTAAKPAAATTTTTQRDVNQQTRIEQGLKNGSLSTKEAAGLEKEEARVARLQARDLKQGKMTGAERAQLNVAQNKVGRDISLAKHNAATGNPTSTSSRRLQADVARNVSQQKRVASGVKNGTLTNHEVSTLESGQAHVDRKEASAAANGHVGVNEQRGVQRAENHQSKRIHHEKTDAQLRG